MKSEVIKDVCWTSDDYTASPIRGVVLSLHGLGGTGGKTTPSNEEYEYCRAGGLVVHPYYGPWSWMNGRARRMIDDLIDAVHAKWKLADSVPLVVTGWSMGGQGSLTYTRYARRKVKACLAGCPVCDLRYHFNERPDLPTTIRHAADYADDMEPFFRENSPLEQVAGMPNIPYLFVAGDRDKAVNKPRHSDAMVAAARARGLNVQYLETPLMGHGGPMPVAIARQIVDFVCKAMG